MYIVAPGLKLDQIVPETRQSKSGALLKRYSLLIFLPNGISSVLFCLVSNFSRYGLLKDLCFNVEQGLSPWYTMWKQLRA